MGEMGDAPRTDGPPPLLSRPIEDEVRNPFAPVDPTPRRRAAPTPPPRPVVEDPFAPPFARPETVPPPVPTAPPPRADRAPAPPVEALRPTSHPLPPAPDVTPSPDPQAPTGPTTTDPVASAPWSTVAAASVTAPPVAPGPASGWPVPPAPGDPVLAGPTTPPAPPVPGSGGALFSGSPDSRPAARIPAADPLDEMAFPPRPVVAQGTSLFRPPPPSSPEAAVGTGTTLDPSPPLAGGPPAGPAGFPPHGAPGSRPRRPGVPPQGPPGLPPWPGAGGPPGPFAPAPAPAPSRGGRLVLVGVVAVVLLVALAAAAVVVPRVLGTSDDADDAERAATTEPPHPDVWDERVAPIAEWVATERDLAFEHPVTVRFLAEEDYQDEATGGEDEMTEEAEEEAEHFVAVLRAMGLVHGEVDLGQAGETLQGEGTLAYYVPEEQVVYVRGTELTPGVRVTIAHELTHVLQDQHFDLERIADPDFDRSEGLRALAEGDAQRIEDAFVEDRLTAEERTAYEEETETVGDDAEAALAEDVPPALLTLFAAPYTLGAGIVDHLTRLEGPEVIDDLLEDPPTEEELLDPSARGTVRTEVQEVEVSAPEGAEDVETDVVGPLGWYLMLASRGRATDALRTVDGWGGDAFVSYRDEGTTCVRARVVGDDAAATDRLAVALEAWANAGPAGSATVELVDGSIRVEACDPGGDAGSNGEVSQDLLALPVVRSELRTTFEESGWPTDQARCAADQVVAVIPLEVFLSGASPTPEQTAQIDAAVRSCT